ncbi:MAG TPA: aldehyde dehydrogenase family protein [Candidatus Nitrosopolaris sp.]|nr:aldehyde dehydrogenase family protein [Candidatus Nitrosopolaris sp.]
MTGSVNTGKTVAELASRGLKRFVLELGGSDAFVVLEDADVNQTAHLAVQSGLLNTGKSSIAAKRFIVIKDGGREIFKTFRTKCRSRSRWRLHGFQNHSWTFRENQQQILTNQVEDANSKGAKILTGDSITAGDGYFYLPTIIINGNHQMAFLKEDVFRPVPPIVVVDNEARCYTRSKQYRIWIRCEYMDE